METLPRNPADEADHAEEPARPTMDRATFAQPPTAPVPATRPRLAIVDERIAFAFAQVFLAGFFTDRAIPERAPWLRTLVVGWAVRNAVYTALWTAAANWDWAFPRCMRRLAPQTWIKRFPFEVGDLRPLSGIGTAGY